ncbi:MAG: NAD(+)/NADH kinase [Calditrichia bacterium]
MKLGITANTRKDLFWDALPGLLKWLSGKKVPFVLSKKIVADSPYSLKKYDSKPMKEIPDHCDMILAFGGDGTILRTARTVGERQTPILGVNVGGLGFLTDVPLNQFEKIITDILEGNYHIEERLMLKGLIGDDPKPLFALNDIVMDKGRSPRVIEVRIDVNDQYLNAYIADGLIISTPTGSTGYSLSSGGPITVPSSKVLIINPICPHSLTNRPVIIPHTSLVKATLRSESEEIIVSADGADTRSCKSHTHLTIEKAPFAAHLVKPPGSDFFKLLQTKLNWGEDFRNKSRWSYNS